MRKDLSGSGSWKRSRDIANALIRHTTATVAASGIPYYTSDGNNSLNSDFNNRLMSAVSDVLLQGHSRVIVVSNDYPDLTAKHITALVNHSQSPVSWLRDMRGGIMALSISSAAFNDFSKTRFRWQGNIALQLCGYYGNAGVCNVDTPAIADINTVADLRMFLRSRVIGKFNSLVKELLGHVFVPNNVHSLLYSSQCLSGSSCLRGPPICS